MRILGALLALYFTTLSTSAHADIISPSHLCRKPIKPYEFTDEWHITQFKNDVDRYKRCISDFVDEQNDDARKHQDAAQEAIDEWNAYVRYELS